MAKFQKLAGKFCASVAQPCVGLVRAFLGLHELPQGCRMFNSHTLYPHHSENMPRATKGKKSKTKNLGAYAEKASA